LLEPVESTTSTATAAPPNHSVLEAVRAREERILDAIRKRAAERDVNKRYESSLSTGQRIADGVAATMGSWRFIIIQSFILLVWIALNATELIFHAWDPYPFILLNLALSFQAAYAAPIIMMSQNRQSAKDRLGAELDLQTNIKAETLIEELHGSMDDLRMEKWSELLRIQQQQIAILDQLMQRLDKQQAD
jgi:uncharacterized membrane protein